MNIWPEGGASIFYVHADCWNGALPPTKHLFLLQKPAKHLFLLLYFQIKTERIAAQRSNPTSMVRLTWKLSNTGASSLPITQDNLCFSSYVQTWGGGGVWGQPCPLSWKLRALLWAWRMWDETQPAHLQVAHLSSLCLLYVSLCICPHVSWLSFNFSWWFNNGIIRCCTEKLPYLHRSHDTT